MRSKLSGIRQVFAVMFHTYETPIPTPVHNLRPARETCEACHWPQKYGEDRLRVINRFGDDENNSAVKTVLLIKIGGGNKGIGIQLAEGMRTRELIRVDPWQMMYAALGANVFYFLSGPVMGMLEGKNLFERRALEARRKAAVEYLGRTIFRDRSHGARVAARVLARTPIPRSREFLQFEVKGK